MSTNKGKRMYACDDCGSRNMYSKVQFSRASKPRCPKCGCTRLELVSVEGVKEQFDIIEARKVQKSITDVKTGRIND